MKRFLLFVVVLICSTRLEGAVAFEHASAGAKVTSASTTGPSFNLTCDGSAGEKAFVAIAQQVATTSVTVGGTGATEVPTDSPQTNNGYVIKLFSKDSPGSGSLAVAITWGSAIVGNAVATCYSGANTGLDSHAGTNNGNISTANTTASTTVVASNSWLVMAGVTSNGPNDPTTGTGTTLRSALSDANTIAVALFDSNGAVGTGSQSLVMEPGALSFQAAVIVSIAPSGGGGGSTCKGGLLLLGAGGCH